MIAVFNVLWFITFGWASALLTLIMAAVMAITIVGWPIAKALGNLAKLTAFPFGKRVIREVELKADGEVSESRVVGGQIVNIIWALTLGWAMAALYIFLGLLAAVTIIGIPVAIVYFRTAKFVIWPMGAKVVSAEAAMVSKLANEMDRRAKLAS